MISPQLSLVIATKDRPRELVRLFESLKVQTVPPDEVILVDGGRPPLTEKIWKTRSFPVKYLRCFPPSATKQRNRGLSAVSPGIDLVGFLDDDAVLEPKALEEMLKFWKAAPDVVAGAAFNQVDPPPVVWPALKSMPFTEGLRLYSRRVGAVSASGFQTMIGGLDLTTDVQWLATGAVVWRRTVFATHRFDEWYSGYSYLEDLDFSYAIGRTNRLVVVAPARYHHFPPSKDRGGDYQFGRREVKARFHFVVKNSDLSRWSCLTALILRMGISLALMIKNRRPAFAGRILGNLVGLAEVAAGGSIDKCR